MIIEKRLDIILSTLKKEEMVSNKDLTKKLGVSESTLRRDLTELEKTGKITRVHGGAILNIESSEIDYSDNEKSMIDEKRQIAKKASDLIKDARFIYLDAGSTCHQLIDYLDKSMNITIVTNGLMHIEKLILKKIPTIILEGMIKESTKVASGVRTLDSIGRYNFDLAFIGANGYDREGYYTADINEAAVKSKAIANSNRAYILADRSKESVKYFARIAGRDEVELIREDQ